MHVTLRSGFRPLRSQHVFPTLRLAIAQASRCSPDFRVVHFSVQAEHLHLIVEATDTRTLSSGMRGLAIRIAKTVDALVFRRGKFWAERWHGRPLSSPRAVRNALLYVLANAKKHGERGAGNVDAYSSAPHFDGFAEYKGKCPVEVNARAFTGLGMPPPTLPARTWLLSHGWRKNHRISLQDVPSST